MFACFKAGHECGVVREEILKAGESNSLILKDFYAVRVEADLSKAIHNPVGSLRRVNLRTSALVPAGGREKPRSETGQLSCRAPPPPGSRQSKRPFRAARRRRQQPVRRSPLCAQRAGRSSVSPAKRSVSVRRRGESGGAAAMATFFGEVVVAPSRAGVDDEEEAREETPEDREIRRELEKKR